MVQVSMTCHSDGCCHVHTSPQSFRESVTLSSAGGQMRGRMNIGAAHIFQLVVFPKQARSRAAVDAVEVWRRGLKCTEATC